MSAREAKAEERWSELRAAVRRAGPFLPRRRTFPDAGRAMALASAADAQRAQDDVLEEAYQAEVAGNAARARYLMRIAGQVRPS